MPLILYHYEDGFPLYDSSTDNDEVWGITYDKASETASRKLTWRVPTWRLDERPHALFRVLGVKSMEKSLRRTSHQISTVSTVLDSPNYEVMPCHGAFFKFTYPTCTFGSGSAE